MTAVYCATFCSSSECGMFHFTPVHNECSVFLERDYDTGVTLASDPDWVVGYRQQQITVTQGEWMLVFRAQSSIGVSDWDTWTNTGLHNDNPVPEDFPLPCLRLTEYGSCDRLFRSHILDNWSNVKEVGCDIDWYYTMTIDMATDACVDRGTGPSRDLFESVQVESDAVGDQVDHDRAIDREEDDADQYNEDEFVHFNDDSDTDTTTSDSGGVESADPNLNSSISEELINGTIVRTRSYFGKDGSEWKNIPMAPNAQTTSANIVNFPRNSIPNTECHKSCRDF
ncbi:hypothetical protein PoB_000183600 [Plakobranchus ocellatus]|uniref:Apple domain-containing protein n=1 Tax=Plakobranchus ocellatus TaxID=259542 RepID=A0AAV3XWY5_9GAST|nr:hypothetical protein PoB_000183600 [Plakobranchus ocellatus]